MSPHIGNVLWQAKSPWVENYCHYLPALFLEGSSPTSSGLALNSASSEGPSLTDLLKMNLPHPTPCLLLSLPRKAQAPSLASFRSLFKHHLPSKAFPDHSETTASPPSFIFLHNTYPRLTHFIFSFLSCLLSVSRLYIRSSTRPEGFVCLDPYCKPVPRTVPNTEQRPSNIYLFIITSCFLPMSHTC